MDSAIWKPQPRQQEFMQRWEDEALYGGAAGGGKSDALVAEALRQVDVPNYWGLLMRKTVPELAELIAKTQALYPVAYPGAVYNATKHIWTFPSGAQIFLGSMHHTSDRQKYQGLSYDFIGFDECTHFSWDEYSYLFSRNRAKGPGTRVYTRATANPGGIGHGWVKSRFIDAGKPTETVWEKVSVAFPDGHTEVRWKSRVFVPSSVFDNQELLRNDPNYLTRLASLPEAERKALLYGDWNTYKGQFFSELKDDPEHYADRRWTHVIDPFEIPKDWKIYRSFDWGYRHPFSCGWWAVDYEGVAYRILELYGCTDTPNEGVKWEKEKVFEEIARIEREHRWLAGKTIHGVADPAIFQENGGPSIAETARGYRVYFDPGDNKRIAGWQEVRRRLAFDENGQPMMYVFSNCKGFTRTMPLLIFDDRKIEDCDTEGEDHIADEVRYFCMARPIKPRKQQESDPFARNPAHIFLDVPKEDIGRRKVIPRMEILED